MKNLHTDRNSALAELAATIPPNIRRLEALEAELDPGGREIVRHAIDAELSLLVELQRRRLGVNYG